MFKFQIINQLLIITQFSIKKIEKKSINQSLLEVSVCVELETNLSQVGGSHTCKTHQPVRDRSHAPRRWQIFPMRVISHFDTRNHLLQISNNAIHCTSTLAWPSTGPCDANAVKHWPNEVGFILSFHVQNFYWSICIIFPKILN